MKGIDPNWVVAHNALGYIKMMRERFSEAEEHFKSYRFIAPDQANPHDSLGELFVAVGRNDEAEASFETAIEIKSNFWPAYNHIALMKSFTGDLEGAFATDTLKLVSGTTIAQALSRGGSTTIAVILPGLASGWDRSRRRWAIIASAPARRNEETGCIWNTSA